MSPPSWTGGFLIPVAPSGAPFVPTDVAGCMFWVRSDLGITVETGVSEWADQSGSGDPNRNALQASASQQPTYNESDADYNGHPSLTYVQDSLQGLVTGTWSEAPPASGFTFFFIGNGDGTSTIFYWADTSRDSVFAVSVADDGMWLNAGGSYLMGPTPPGELASPFISAFDNDATSSTGSVYFNSTTAVISGVTGDLTMLGLTLGNRGPIGGDGLSGKIVEAIMYDHILSDGDRATVMDYLAARYAITLV